MQRAKHNDDGAVGIDLMITYVGIVIMMIVIGSTAVGMVEKMGQQTQHTALDANKEAGTKMIVVGAWVEDGYDDFLFMIEYQSQGKNVLAEDVEWVLWCVEDDTTLHYRSGTIDDWPFQAPPPFPFGRSERNRAIQSPNSSLALVTSSASMAAQTVLA